MFTWKDVLRSVGVSSMLSKLQSENVWKRTTFQQESLYESSTPQRYCIRVCLDNDLIAKNDAIAICCRVASCALP